MATSRRLQETCNKLQQDLEQAHKDARQLHIAAIAFEEDNVRLAAETTALERQNARLDDQLKGQRSIPLPEKISLLRRFSLSWIPARSAQRHFW